MNYFLDTHVRKDLWSSPTSHPHPLWTSVWWQTSILEELRNTPGRDLESFKTLPLEDCRTALGLFTKQCLVLQVKNIFREKNTNTCQNIQCALNSS